jgi:serine/threonine protein kinase
MWVCSKYQYQLDHAMQGKVSEKGLQLLRRLLEYDPERRIRSDEALDHDFFREAPAFYMKYAVS